MHYNDSVKASYARDAARRKAKKAAAYKDNSKMMFGEHAMMSRGTTAVEVEYKPQEPGVAHKVAYGLGLMVALPVVAVVAIALLILLPGIFKLLGVGGYWVKAFKGAGML